MYKMDKKDLRIVYLGTPDFAVEPLKVLVEDGYNVVGVITMPDKPMGKHQSTLQASPVKQYAVSRNIPILQPEKLKDPAFLDELRSWNADLQIVVAFRMLPEVVWDMPRFGTFNLHASLLPQYRGAAPINWAIINGDKETGVTTFFLTHEIDTGKVILQERVPIRETDDAEIIHDKLMLLGGQLVKQTVDRILSGELGSIPQEQLITDDVQLKPAPKIFRETCKINWNRSTEQVYNFIRGLSPYPGAWTELVLSDGRILNLKVFETEKVDTPPSLPPGNILSDGKTYIELTTTDGRIRLIRLQQSGKRRMSAEEFLLGARL